MQKQLFQDMSPKEREQYLRDSAYRIDAEEYLKRLSPEERQKRQEDLSKLQFEILKEEREKAEVSKQYTSAIKDMKGRNKELVDTLKNNAETVCEEVFFIADEESRMMGIYTKEGELIRSRPMTSEELQKSIFELQKAQ